MGALIATGCVKDSPSALPESPKTFLRSSLPPAVLYENVQEFLRTYSAYEVLIRDPSRGLLVTDWWYALDGHRRQLTLRVNQDVKGAVLTVHMLLQSPTPQSGWKEFPGGGYPEAEFIAELKRKVRVN